MTRENNLPILRQGSRTCETKSKGGQEGGECKDGNIKRVTMEMEMRGAMREGKLEKPDDGEKNGEIIELETRGAMRTDKLGAGLSKKGIEEGNSGVGTTTKIGENNNKNKKEYGGVAAHAVGNGYGGESESMEKGKTTWGIMGRVGNQRARPQERGDLWEGIYGDGGNSRMKSGLTKSEGGPTQDAAKSGDEESTQRGRPVHAG